ncbi:hypothetical protein [Poritiphilus flavus]|uniref:3-keto-disaccharide hydrolase domain-containing protein n=1 Tax=Poritiphilus flavus TaxID=2697053 RepID=A0A6L9EEV7_9FLAO|nr:hypothetical protein [Poritiphilus flavus]NAS13275.1 hypothetical protein [Poritiphilus flavus]
MKSLSETDQRLLEELKKRIEKMSGLGSSTDWAQKDYEFLLFFIEEETGERLSLTTIKRIWKNEYNRLPHLATLDVLSRLAYGSNWHSLKKKKADNLKSPLSSLAPKKNQLKKITTYGLPALIIPLAIFLAWTTGRQDQEPQPVTYNSREISFSFKKTLDNKIPNTVIFNYDLSSVEADSFFLQQSWDRSRRVQISKENKERTDIYYVPGYFTAKLIANDQIVKEIPVHITNDGWFIAARQPMSNILTFSERHWLRQGFLGISKNSLESKKIDLNEQFQQAFYYVKDFELDGDNFYYETKFRIQNLDEVDCPIFNFHIQGVKGYYWIMFGNKGCESELSMRLGDAQHYGKTEDLSKFGTEVSEWQQLTISVVDKKVNIGLNGTTIFEGSYTESVGGIMEISYFTNSPGFIDDVELRDLKGNVRFSDNFDWLIQE